MIPSKVYVLFHSTRMPSELLYIYMYIYITYIYIYRHDEDCTDAMAVGIYWESLQALTTRFLTGSPVDCTARPSSSITGPPGISVEV